MIFKKVTEFLSQNKTPWHQPIWLQKQPLHWNSSVVWQKQWKVPAWQLSSLCPSYLTWQQHLTVPITTSFYPYSETWASESQCTLLVSNLPHWSVVQSVLVNEHICIKPLHHRDPPKTLCCLGHFLAMYTTSLFQIIHSHGFSYLFYVDDTQLYLAFAPDDSTVSACLSDCLSVTTAWMKAHHL